MVLKQAIAVHCTAGLAFDDWDLDYYSELFTTKVQRNPTTVELFDLAQSNSEHSRHWFFKVGGWLATVYFLAILHCKIKRQRTLTFTIATLVGEVLAIVHSVWNLKSFL